MPQPIKERQGFKFDKVDVALAAIAVLLLVSQFNGVADDPSPAQKKAAPLSENHEHGNNHKPVRTDVLTARYGGDTVTDRHSHGNTRHVLTKEERLQRNIQRIEKKAAEIHWDMSTENHVYCADHMDNCLTPYDHFTVEEIAFLLSAYEGKCDVAEEFVWRGAVASISENKIWRFFNAAATGYCLSLVKDLDSLHPYFFAENYSGQAYPSFFEQPARIAAAKGHAGIVDYWLPYLDEDGINNIFRNAYENNQVSVLKKIWNAGKRPDDELIERAYVSAWVFKQEETLDFLEQNSVIDSEIHQRAFSSSLYWSKPERAEEAVRRFGIEEETLVNTFDRCQLFLNDMCLQYLEDNYGLVPDPPALTNRP